jgi:hypothetical protein
MKEKLKVEIDLEQNPTLRDELNYIIEELQKTASELRSSSFKVSVYDATRPFQYNDPKYSVDIALIEEGRKGIISFSTFYIFSSKDIEITDDGVKVLDFGVKQIIKETKSYLDSLSVAELYYRIFGCEWKVINTTCKLLQESLNKLTNEGYKIYDIKSHDAWCNSIIACVHPRDHILR